MIGRHCRLSSGILNAVIRDRKTLEEEEKVVVDSYNILKKLKLEIYVNNLAKNLPYGAQKRLEIARALATDPFLLLLDEPAAGMNNKETKELEENIIYLMNDSSLTVFLIEHDMSFVMSISKKVFVLDYGKLIASGKPEEIKKNPVVIEAYLGEEQHA